MEVRRDRQTLSGEDYDEEDDSGHVYEYDDHEYDALFTMMIIKTTCSPDG